MHYSILPRSLPVPQSHSRPASPHGHKSPERGGHLPTKAATWRPPQDCGRSNNSLSHSPMAKVLPRMSARIHYVKYQWSKTELRPKQLFDIPCYYLIFWLTNSKQYSSVVACGCANASEAGCAWLRRQLNATQGMTIPCRPWGWCWIDADLGDRVSRWPLHRSALQRSRHISWA